MSNINENRICQNCKGNFLIDTDDFNFYNKIGVPAPTWCPFCRYIRKLTFINGRSLHKRECGHCNKSTISMYGPESPINSWCVKCYLSDAFDARDYARGYDFSQTFFEQFKELKYSTPHRALDQNERNGTGCEYSNFCYTSKDIYLSFFTSSSENIMYSKCHFKHNKNCMDCFTIENCDRGYELVQSKQNYNSTFLTESNQCVDSHFLYDCINCTDCCMSVNLRNKSFVFKNQQFSRDEYKKRVGELMLETYTGQQNAKNMFDEICKSAIHKYAHIKNSVNSEGDFIDNSKNVHHSYGLSNAENVKFTNLAIASAKDCYDLVFTGRLEESYEATVAGRGGSRILFSLSCGGGSNNLYYCDSCRGCSDCFGCVSLSKKQYCIFNKQYTKDEYSNMIEKIKKHMDDMPYVDKVGRAYKFGECFPTELSPFAYNETEAFEENPLSKEQVLAFGYKWKDLDPKSHAPTVQANNLPDSIDDINDVICNEIIECPNKGNISTQCTSAFKIIPGELSFYRLLKLPIPRYCPNCRYHSRMKWKNSFKFYKRTCMCGSISSPSTTTKHNHQGKCEVEFETSYAPDRPEIIYCEKCYQQEVI
ncbi:hypothetical protein IT400_04385 [Candidatus Nomurabacteria bacterium]|nr:hypothetical protein [Candidatus Nomurabacteria bacterium]